MRQLGYRSLEPAVRTELAELALLRGAAAEHEREARRAATLLAEMGAVPSDDVQTDQLR